jgi:hypothetical protein
MSNIGRYMQIPEEQWNIYTVCTSTGGRHLITAPNKTIARLATQGMINVGIKIISIEEVCTWQKEQSR